MNEVFLKEELKAKLKKVYNQNQRNEVFKEVSFNSMTQKLLFEPKKN